MNGQLFVVLCNDRNRAYKAMKAGDFVKAIALFTMCAEMLEKHGWTMSAEVMRQRIRQCG